MSRVGMFCPRLLFSSATLADRGRGHGHHHGHGHGHNTTIITITWKWNGFTMPSLSFTMPPYRRRHRVIAVTINARLKAWSAVYSVAVGMNELRRPLGAGIGAAAGAWMATA